MLTPLLTIISIFAIAAIVVGSLLLLLCVENRRFWKNNQLRATPSEPDPAKVNLIIPCKGVSENSRKNLEAFLFQNHPNFRITFSIESPSDPIVALIRELQREYRHVESSMVFAGPATTRGQKVHNLLAAIERIPKEVDIYAFADMDALVGPSWLRWLCIGVGRENCGARTGYRWMVPTQNNIATLLGVSVNNSIAACLGKANQNLVWGGSWAIHRKVFQQSGIAAAWAQVLSDDLAASCAIRNSRFDGKALQIQFVPQCLSQTDAQFNWSSLFEFVVRQLKITRLYARGYWAMALLTSLLTQVGLWGSVVAWIGIMQTGERGLRPTLLMFAFLSIYVLGVARASIRQNMARRMMPQWRSQRSARRFDLFLWPLTGLFSVASLLLSSVGKRISWSNIHYRVDPGGRTMILGRNIESEHWPVRTEASADTTQALANAEPSSKLQRKAG